MKTYFVTGATGAVGSALIPLLLADEDTCVRLLIRANSPEHLTERMEELFRFWQFGAREDALRRRITAIRGDATAPRFDLLPEEYRDLTTQSTHIIHAAGSVRMNLPLEEARRSAVESARNIVALARACEDNGQLEKVEFVSTVGVAGRNPGLIPEDWIVNERRFHNSYEAAKAEAETYVSEQLREGVPITVHRPSMVVGDSGTGGVIHFQIFYHLCEFLSGRRTLGLFPELGDARLDIVPVDYVARVIAWSSRRKETAGRIFHTCSGPENAIRLVELRDKVRERFAAAGMRLPPVLTLAPGLFRTLLGGLGLCAGPKARRAIKTLPLFLEYLAENQAFANTATRATLAAEGIGLPSVDSFLDRVLTYYLGSRDGHSEAA